MQVTNIHNLPDPLVRALSHDSYKSVGRISVTGLLKPPRIRALEIRHDEEITEDVSERIYRALGTSLHKLMESNASPDSLTEERLKVEVLGWKLSGMPDLLDNDGTLWDFKLTSIWSFILGGRVEWGQQLQIYGWLYRKHGFTVKKMKNLLVFRDYSQAEKLRMKDYPAAEAEVLEYEPLPHLEVEGFVEERMKLHQAADSMSDDKLPICSPEERWEKPTTWAVMKPGNKKATRVLDTESEAKEYVKANNPLWQIVERAGQCIRCERYCKVNKWCNFWATIAPKPQDA
jgi:hypothetical protein